MMVTTANATKTVSVSTRIDATELSEGLRFARYCQLEELPGLVFGIMTVMYIVSSLAGLAM